METRKYNKDLYSKTALIKAAYNFTDSAYIHLDSDENYYYVTFEPKDGMQMIEEKDFVNEMLAQSVRHEVYKQTKNIRELMMARAMASSVVMSDENVEETFDDDYSEEEILKDWFANND